jgi:hypothetical protein
MIQVANVDELPMHLDMKLVNRHLAPLSRKTLIGWTQKGWVRSAKIGESQQSRRLFNTQDVLDVLDRIGRGHEPRIRSRG